MKGTPFMSAFFCAFPLDREVIQEYSLNKHMNKCSYDKTKREAQNFYSSSRNTRDFSRGIRAQKGKLASLWV